jgi:HAE1 family hydrophobic/amphiphilic exporter-1
MSPSLLSVRQPVFILSIVILMLVLGAMSLRKMPMSLFPDVSLPTVTVETEYPGAGPSEIETEVSKVLEDEVATISGVDKVSSTNQDGFSVLKVEFNMRTNLNFAEQEVRAKVQNAMRDLPNDIEQPVIRKVSPSDEPIMSVALESDLPQGKLYDLAKEVISPQFESVQQVGQVDILGGRKREIHVELDMNKLNESYISGTMVSKSLAQGGRNVPAGKIDSGANSISFRTIAQYLGIEEIAGNVIRVVDSRRPMAIENLGKVHDTLEDEKSRTTLNGKSAVVFTIFRQSGANAVRVADDVKKKVEKINHDMAERKENSKMTVVMDQSRKIRANVHDVYESIIFGVILTIIVVYFFLGSLKSTLITSFALPNSLLGAVILMSYFNFSVNIMSLLAMSLVVGLLVDDAIVVRENIFRKLEAGLSPKMAAIVGTQEVTLAVIATTMTVLAVFGPIGNLDGIVGQFFKEFGLTICFAMAISLFDGLFVAPVLSAYAAGGHSHGVPTGKLARLNYDMLKAFDRFQTKLERWYTSSLKLALRFPLRTLGIGIGIFFFSLFTASKLNVTFLPPQDDGEFYILFELPPGASLDGTEKIAKEAEAIVRKRPEVENVLTTVGNVMGETNKGSMFIRLVESKHRKKNTSAMKNTLREDLKSLAQYKMITTDKPATNDSRPFNLNVVGQKLEDLQPYAEKVQKFLENNPALQQVDTSFRLGKPEYQMVLRPSVAKQVGITITDMGAELRTLIEGDKPALFRENGVSYDVRVRLQPDQRDLRVGYERIKLRNLNGFMFPLKEVAELKAAQGPSTILRENRTRYIQLSADLTPGGAGIGGVISQLNAASQGELKPPPGVKFSLVGEGERFAELVNNIMVSMGLGMLFIFLVLASLYGSFITPVTIMLVIPLAATGAFFALFITNTSLDLFSMIGCIVLAGLATKNSILLIDATKEHQKKGTSRIEALVMAGESRLRPILMTSFALIGGMIPVAVGLNEASKSRTGLGIVIIGGAISSTVLTLYVIPCAHIYIDRFQDWIMVKYHAVFGEDHTVV